MTEPWMECSRCGEWQTKHKETCPNCGAPNSALIVRTDSGDEDVTGVHKRLLSEARERFGYSPDDD